MCVCMMFLMLCLVLHDWQGGEGKEEEGKVPQTCLEDGKGGEVSGGTWER